MTSSAGGKDADPDANERRRILVYVIGHLLLNAVLRFPGPILSLRALTAYTGVSETETETMTAVFEAARYVGPFAELGPYFWASAVDDRLADLMSALPAEFEAETQGEWHREAIELNLNRKLARHTCPRCNGQNGGFYCPLTARAVCIRQDCSVGSNSWIPQGATLCRIEREYYDEWSPILGF
jgi:hypothetical protein